jgi:hypothetical protein
MRRSTAVLALFLGVGLAASSCGKGSDGLTIWQADLSPANEVPARPIPASGTAGLSFDGTTLTYSVELHDIDSVLFGHIHSGAAGVNGPVRIFLFPGPTTGPVNGVLVQGSLTAADMRPGITFEQLISEMRAGNAYVNFHTTQFPGGAVRGQARLLK